MQHRTAGDLTHDLLLPTLLFAGLGGMTWAVRGSSGYGATAGCLFAGVAWGAAWWFIAREPGPRQTRRYASGWIVLAMALGVAVSGDRGWMQWSSFFAERLQTNTSQGEYLPISRTYGFVWLFIAGMPWAGIGACLLAWCGHGRRLGWAGWLGRLGFAFGGAALGRVLFESLPEVFLPLYKTYAAQYADLQANPNLRRLINDNREAITHLGFYLGCLAFEAGRRDRKNVILIATVGVVNGLGWALLQNWMWARSLWPKADFNFWRCWESSGGISIGIAYGVAYYLVNRQASEKEREHDGLGVDNEHPNLERLGVYLGLLLGLGLSVRNGLKGWANLYLGNEDHWSQVLWWVIGPVLILTLAAIVWGIRKRPLPRGYQGDVFPHAGRLIWTVLITQNVLAQLVTGPWSAWSEVAFSLYYLLLFALSAVIIHHYRCLRGMAVPARGG
jgi:hypothetical protein